MFSMPGYLSLGYSTPFLSIGSSYVYPSLAAAKAAVVSVGEEISTQGLPLEICPLVFVFTGTGNGIFSVVVLEPIAISFTVHLAIFMCSYFLFDCC